MTRPPIIREIDGADEAGMIEALHDDTLSDEPDIACAARCLKAIMPLFMRWLESEMVERVTPPQVLLSAATTVAASLVGTTAQNIVPPTMFPLTLLRAANVMSEHMQRTAEAVRGQK